jgi:hypothetical protein
MERDECRDLSLENNIRMEELLDCEVVELIKLA